MVCRNGGSGGVALVGRCRNGLVGVLGRCRNGLVGRCRTGVVGRTCLILIFYVVLPSQPGRRRASCTYVTGIKETKDGESYLQVTGSDMDAAMVLLRLWRFVENDIL